MKICHITTVHPRYENRIFYKQCISLSDLFDVYLIVADGLGDETLNNVRLIDIGLRKKSIFKRFIIDSLKVYRKAVSMNCDVYHFHDPELIFIGFKLKSIGKKVVYDVHEDLPRQILSKPYFSLIPKAIIGWIFEKIENHLAKRFNYIVTVTSHIENRFKKINTNTITVKNFPEIVNNNVDMNWNNKKNIICYVGSISEVRGIKEIVTALNKLDVVLYLGGLFNSKKIENEVKNMEAWSKVVEFGYVNSEQANQIYKEAKVGLVLLHPTINYLDALPTKMFEYMLAGLPLIVSNIPLWEKIVIENKCGLVVNPFDIGDITNKIQYLLTNNDIAQKMGANGRLAVKSKYNWITEKTKLIEIYKVMENE